MEKTRIDKWLWAVRLFKTRSLASEACDKGKVRVSENPVKASRNIKIGDIISLRKGAFTLQYEVLQLTENRVAAKLVAGFCKDITPIEEIEKMRMQAMQARYYPHGEGRPTKRNRRELDEYFKY